MHNQTMNPRVKRLWVQALRSEDYKQGRRKLRSEDDKFCCLGVLCNLHALEHPELAAKEKFKRSYLGKTCWPAKEVLKWAGLDKRDKFVSINLKGPWGNTITLARLNDEHRKSFAYIADIIQHYL